MIWQGWKPMFCINIMIDGNLSRAVCEARMHGSVRGKISENYF